LRAPRRFHLGQNWFEELKAKVPAGGVEKEVYCRQGDDGALVSLSHNTSPGLHSRISRRRHKSDRLRQSAGVPTNVALLRHFSDAESPAAGLTATQ